MTHRIAQAFLSFKITERKFVAHIVASGSGGIRKHTEGGRS